MLERELRPGRPPYPRCLLSIASISSVAQRLQALTLKNQEVPLRYSAPSAVQKNATYFSSLRRTLPVGALGSESRNSIVRGTW